MLKVAVLDDYQHVAMKCADWASLGPDCEVTVFDRNLGSLDEAATSLAPFDVLCLMRERMPLPAALIARLPNLKLVIVTGARVRTIDLDAAGERGIVVSHTRAGESQHATPELAWGLILASVRHIPAEDAGIRAGGWQRTVGTTLAGKTLGLLGLGKLGSRTARIGAAFGMEVIAWSQNLTEERAAEVGARRVDKDRLFASSDVLSIHLILGDRTRGLVGAADIARMKPGALLVNTSRGPIVDEAALIDALHRDAIRAALDVFDQEPLPPEHPLRQAPNTVLTPHLGYVTEGAYREFYADTVDNIVAWRTGKPCRVLSPA